MIMDDLNQIIDKIIRSDRRTCALEINKQGRLIIRVPKFFSQNDINKILDDKRKWILSHYNSSIDKINEAKSIKENKVFYRGSLLEIEFVKLNNYLLKFENGKVFIDEEHKDNFKNILYNWLRINAKNHLVSQTIELAKRYNFTINNVRVKEQKRRWGSCSNKKNINLNWRLIMANDSIINYIIIHELSHTIELNHSPKFWKIVETIVPNYRIIENELSSIEHLLDL